MVDIEEQRRNLKQIRTLQGWREAYQVAGLPDDGASDNTKSKRLSRLINRRTGGYKPLSQETAQRVSNSIQDEMRLDAFAELRAERAIRKVNRIKAQGRRESREAFGSDGSMPSTRQLKLNLDKNKPLTNEQKERIRSAFREAQESGESAKIRSAYASLLNDVDLDMLDEDARTDFSRKQARANRAVERDNQ